MVVEPAFNTVRILPETVATLGSATLYDQAPEEFEVGSTSVI